MQLAAGEHIVGKEGWLKGRPVGHVTNDSRNALAEMRLLASNLHKDFSPVHLSSAYFPTSV